MNEKNLITYYNKFNEDKRLTRRHGIIEYRTATKYIHEYLNTMDNPKIIDIGAGTGAYSISLANEGYDVTAVELIKHNLMTLRKNSDKVKTYLGDAIDLHKFKDNTFDIVLLFGPMYHLISNEDKIKALSEAKRIVKENGLIFISYYMNEYAFITYAIVKGHILECLNNGQLDENYHTKPIDGDLYTMVRIEDIENNGVYCRSVCRWWGACRHNNPLSVVSNFCFFECLL